MSDGRAVSKERGQDAHAPKVGGSERVHAALTDVLLMVKSDFLRVTGQIRAGSFRSALQAGSLRSMLSDLKVKSISALPSGSFQDFVQINPHRFVPHRLPRLGEHLAGSSHSRGCRLIAVGCLVALVLAGCGDKKVIPFLGQWNGQFAVSKVLKGPDSPDDRKHHTLRGYVSIRLNKKSYLMHLEGEQQQIDIKGEWSYAGQQVTLDPKDIKVNSDGGDKGPNPNLKYVPDEDLYSAYQKKITLKLSPDGSTLQGLTTTIAFLEGIHTFKKD